jgi:hypothetical protein
LHRRMEQRIARWVILVFASATLASTLLLNPIAATPVGACGTFGVEFYGPIGAVQVWDSRVRGGTWLEFEIVTYNDGCGSRFYRLYEWDTTGTIADLHLDLRVWVCGVYQRTFVADVWSNSGYIQSSSYFGPGCGRQADDYGSSISSGWFSPSGGYVYITSG